MITRQIHLNSRAQAALIAGFEEKLTLEQIAREVSKINGRAVSSRTVCRLRSDWRRKIHLKRIVHEGIVASRACDGDGASIEYLARNIELDARWAERRKEGILETLKAFLREPSAKSMAEVRNQLMLFLFESQFEVYVQKFEPTDEGNFEL